MIRSLELLRIGQVFAGRYRVEGFLGGGRSSQVYEAVDAFDGGHKVAIKAFSPRLLPSAVAVRRFEFAMHADRRLIGPHVARTLDGGVDGDTRIPFCVTELLAGETLESAVKRKGPMRAQRMVECMRQVTRGLDAGHALTADESGVRDPIVHGNLSPGSIFLRRWAANQRVVTILDFGLTQALALSGGATGGGALGSPGYSSCEQLCGYEVTPRCDVWSFALVAFFLLSGHHYWRAANGDLDDGAQRRQLFDEILNHAIVPPSFRVRELGVNVEVPPKFDAWFGRCLDRDAEKRFATAVEAFAELERAFEPSEAAPLGLLATPSVVAKKVARKHWALASLVVVGWVLLAMLVLRASGF